MICDLGTNLNKKKNNFAANSLYAIKQTNFREIILALIYQSKQGRKIMKKKHNCESGQLLLECKQDYKKRMETKNLNNN